MPRNLSMRLLLLSCLVVRSAALRPTLVPRAAPPRSSSIRAALTDEARSSLVKAAQNARFNRRIKGASEAPPLTDELAVGTQVRFEADAAQRTWEDIREAYPALGGVGNAELAASYATLTDEEKAKDPETLGFVTGRIGGDAPPDPNRVEGGSGASADLSGLSAGALPLVALVVAAAAFTAFSSNACNDPALGSSTARACEEQAEFKRTGVPPVENDFERYGREITESSRQKIKAAGF